MIKILDQQLSSTQCVHMYAITTGLENKHREQLLMLGHEKNLG